MDLKTLNALEFRKIKNLIKNEASSEFGKSMAEQLQPQSSVFDAEKLLSELSEAISMCIKHGNPNTAGVQDISASVRRAQIGGTLSAAELLNVAQNLRTAESLINYYNSEKNRCIEIEHYFKALFKDRKTEKRISDSIISENEIADEASPNLAAIRRRIESTHIKIREHLNSVIHSTKYQKYLQEPIITMRDGRYVVPVKSEHGKDVAGIVHDMSSTGATLFIEPSAVVRENNTLKELELGESAEIERILAELSSQVSEIADNLLENQRIIGEIDFLFAKARYAVKSDAIIPKLNSNAIINIIKGRHPLLSPDTVVPISVSLGKSYSTLVITGPNTGGKTVSLKTIGLFCIMAAAGLAVPAADGSELCVFDNIFADIGDEQSIEQSLSTFSSHMTNIVHILKNLTPNSLVLFDELGAGTDPTEGAALAIAILKYAKEMGATVIATTHYSEIKLYALTTDGVENASCEFDVESLRPTYRLLIGIPGKSNAFAISKRLGLPDSIIESATAHLSEENIRFEDVISGLESNRAKAEQERTKAHIYRREIEKLKLELEAEKEKLESSKKKISANAQQQARRIIEEAKREAELLINEIRKAQKDQDRKEQNETINKVKRELNEKIKQTQIIETPKEEEGEIPENLAAGDLVFLADIRQNGVVIAPVKSDGTVLVQVGVLKINSHISNLRVAGEQGKQKTTLPGPGQFKSTLKTEGIKSEIDLRGNTLDDALWLAEKYLDDAFLASLGSVTIIHGKGTGVLRKGIHEMLRRHPHVKSYRLGTFGEGESGVTVVELKE